MVRGRFEGGVWVGEFVDECKDAVVNVCVDWKDECVRNEGVEHTEHTLGLLIGLVKADLTRVLVSFKHIFV
jgi:hypothetical protein